MAYNESDTRTEPSLGTEAKCGHNDGDTFALEPSSSSNHHYHRRTLVSTLSPTPEAARPSSVGWRIDDELNNASQHRDRAAFGRSRPSTPVFPTNAPVESPLSTGDRGVGNGGGAWLLNNTRSRSPDDNNKGADRSPKSGGSTHYSSSAAADRELPFRRRRLLSTFWRRRTIRKIRSETSACIASVYSNATKSFSSCPLVCDRGSCSKSRRIKLLRKRWVPRLLAAVSVFVTGALWFVVITASAGPPEPREAPRNGGNSGGPSSYYQRISGAVGIGPSIDDPWVVREIEIAAAGWHIKTGRLGRGIGGNDAGGGVGDGGMLSYKNVDGVLVGSDGEVQREGVGGWDGEVNRIVTGPLVANNATLPNTDLLLTIFSGNSKVRGLVLIA